MDRLALDAVDAAMDQARPDGRDGVEVGDAPAVDDLRTEGHLVVALEVAGAVRGEQEREVAVGQRRHLGGDLQVHHRRIVTGQQVGADVPGGLDP